MSYGFSEFDLATNSFSFDLYFDSAVIGNSRINQTSYQNYAFFVVKEGT